MEELEGLVRDAGGVEPLAGYLAVSPRTIEISLGAPESGWTDGVARAVVDGTRKLLQMPSQGGLGWQLTRRRVVKDWLLLARWGEPVNDPPLQRA